LRIISTVPSITELLYDLGLEEEVVGITKFCIHPNSWFRSKERIGGTKTLNLEKIKGLNPTLIICNKEENVKEQIDALASVAEILLTDIKNPQDNLDLISELGVLTNKRMTAIKLRQQLESSLAMLSIKTELNALYLIWKDPYMSIGQDTYIHAIMKKCGLRNIFTDEKRYPETTIEKIANFDLDIILLSSEPYPFNEKHKKELEQYIPNTPIHLVDGEAFSWYGTRLIKKATYLKNLMSEINSEL